MSKKIIGLIILASGVLFSLLIIIKIFNKSQNTPNPDLLKEASFYQSLGNNKVACELCPNRCLLDSSQRGLCKVRQNIGGKLYSLVYGKPVTINVDPVEKKPFYHFLPEAKAYSLATAGCNLNCQYCQNWDISQRQPEDLTYYDKSPEQVVNEALESQADIIAFTYNEPTVWYEYMLEIAKLAKLKGLRTVMVSSGYINPKPLLQLLPYLDAVKIDFKSTSSEVYQTLIQGKLEPVLESIKIIYQSGKWLEIVHLVVPSYTDDLNDIQKLCQWVKDNTSVDVPVHLSRFWPRYKLSNLAPTNEETLKKGREICLKTGLKYIYTGNIDYPEGNTTYCPDNMKELIRRNGYVVSLNKLDDQGKSVDCPSTISGVWK